MPATLVAADAFPHVAAGPEHGLPVVLLHGMLGETENWDATIPALAAAGYRVLAPVLPVYTSPLSMTSIQGLIEYVLSFLDTTCKAPCVLVGNSLGGHIALGVAHRRPEAVAALVLSGASGLYEVNIGTSTPRRFDRAFIENRTAYTFYDPVHATPALVDRMMMLLSNRPQLVRLVKMARSARDTHMAHMLATLSMPTLLIWGRQDQITPPDVAAQFHQLLPDSTLCFIDACGHAPMIEQPAAFTEHLLAFLRVRITHRVYAE